MYTRILILIGEVEEEEADKDIQAWPGSGEIRILLSTKREEDVPRRKLAMCHMCLKVQKIND